MKAMILAAGFGRRLGQLTEQLPKPLLPVAGRPVIEHHLLRLAQAGITEVVINIHHRKQLIRQTLAQGTRFGLKITYSEEIDLLDTGGGVKQALEYLSDPFILLNGDIYTDYPLAQLIATPLSGLGHVVLIPKPTEYSHGDCSLESDRVQFSNQGEYTYACMAKLSHQLFTPFSGVFSIISAYQQACQQQALTGEVYQGFWQDIGTHERLAKLNAHLATRG